MTCPCLLLAFIFSKVTYQHLNKAIHTHSFSMENVISLFCQGFFPRPFSIVFFLNSFTYSLPFQHFASIPTDLSIHWSMGTTCLFWSQICPRGMMPSFSSNNPSLIHSSHTCMIDTFFMFSLTIPHLSHIASEETLQKFSELHRIVPQCLLDRKISLHLGRMVLPTSWHLKPQGIDLSTVNTDFHLVPIWECETQTDLRFLCLQILKEVNSIDSSATNPP